jgi:hypothetical protein
LKELFEDEYDAANELADEQCRALALMLEQHQKNQTDNNSK